MGRIKDHSLNNLSRHWIIKLPQKQPGYIKE